MRRYQFILTIFTSMLMLLGLSVVASAQYSGNRRNGGYGNGGYYGNQNIESTVRSLRSQARSFEDTLDRELDRSRYDGSRQEDNLNSLANKFKNAAEDLDDEYDGYRDQARSADEARKVLNLGSQLDMALNQSRVGRNNYALANAWASIENNLMVIARNFNYNYNGSYGRNRGYNDNRNNRNRNRNRNTDWGRNDGPYNNRNSRNLSSTISNLKYKAKNLEDRLDQDRYDRRGSNAEGLSDRFKNAVDDLADEYFDNDDSYNEVNKVLNIAEQLDRELSRNSFGSGVRNEWASIERDLRTLANAYNISYRSNNGVRTGIGEIFKKWPF